MDALCSTEVAITNKLVALNLTSVINMHNIKLMFWVGRWIKNIILRLSGYIGLDKNVNVTFCVAVND
jgi:hypothetical protein